MPGAAEFASCPGCGNSNAKRVAFTWWGGALGPWLFTHVKCASCGRAYNGKTGRPNTGNIIAYFAVSFLVAIAIGGTLLVAQLFH